MNALRIVKCELSCVIGKDRGDDAIEVAERKQGEEVEDDENNLLLSGVLSGDLARAACHVRSTGGDLKMQLARLL